MLDLQKNKILEHFGIQSPIVIEALETENPNKMLDMKYHYYKLIKNMGQKSVVYINDAFK